MYYDDEARRFNFLSGFLLGTVLGTGVALVARPQRVRRRGRVRRAFGAAAKSSEQSITDLLVNARRRR